MAGWLDAVPWWAKLIVLIALITIAVGLAAPFGSRR